MDLIRILVAIIEAIPPLEKIYRLVLKAYVQRKVKDGDHEFLAQLDHIRTDGNVYPLQQSFGRLLDD